METPKEVDILDYPRVIWKWAWLIALILILTAVAALVVSIFLEKVYETEITFRIMRQQRSGSALISQIPTSALAVLGVSSGEDDLQTYSQVLRSRYMIGEVIDALPHLKDKYLLQQGSGLRGILKPYDENILQQIGEDELRKRLLLEKLRESIRVRQLGGDVISVRVKWNDPKEATDIADRLGKIFIEYDRAARQKAADRTLDFIERALVGESALGEDVVQADMEASGVRQALAEAEQKLRDFKKLHKTVVMQEEARKLIEKLVDAEDALSSAIIARKTEEARLADVQEQLKNQSQMAVSAKTVTDNPIIQYLQREMAELEVQAESLKVNMGEANPELKGLENQIAEYEKRIGREIPKIVSQETTSANSLYEFLRQEEVNSLIDITVSAAKVLAVRERIADLEKKLAQMPDEEMQLNNLTREVETYGRIYLTLRQSKSEAQLAKESIATNISILDEPDIPLKAAAPNIPVNTAIGCVVGLILGVGGAFFLEYVRRSKAIHT